MLLGLGPILFLQKSSEVDDVSSTSWPLLSGQVLGGNCCSTEIEK